MSYIISNRITDTLDNSEINYLTKGCAEKNLSCQLSKSKVAVSLCTCKKSSVFPYCDNSSC
ncbi:MAG: hypothetical protein L7V85_07220 [Bacteroidia bacterium]|nr:hypothetical protein [Bacteroidia bacterium]